MTVINPFYYKNILKGLFAYFVILYLQLQHSAV
jgi:hypothetical protein